MSLFRNLLMELKEEPKYTLLDYIESTGTQYIDTGISGNEYGAYEIEMNTLATKANNWEQYFGGDVMPRNEMPKIYYDKNLAKVIIQGGNMSGNNVIIDTYNNTTIIHAFSLADIKHKIAINGSSIYIDDNYIADNRNCVWGNLTFTIFKNHEEGLNASMKLYSLKMWSNNVLVRDFIPVLDSNNVACLYDLVSETFFYNQGTGTFNYKMPSEYTKVKYIRSSGTQYIDSNYKPNDDMIVELDFSTQQYDLGFEVSSRLSNYNNEFTLWGGFSGGIFTRYGTSSGNIIYGTPLSLNARYQVKMGKSIGVQLSTDNFETYSQVINPYSGSINQNSAMTLGIFACHDNSEGTKWGGKTKTTLYALRIYENNVKVREYMPALDENNVACLYETIEGIYYYNAGSGTFTYELL